MSRTTSSRLAQPNLSTLYSSRALLNFAVRLTETTGFSLAKTSHRWLCLADMMILSSTSVMFMT